MKEQRANTKKKFKQYVELWFRPDEQDNGLSLEQKITGAISVGKELTALLRADKCYGDYTIRYGVDIRLLVGVPTWMADDEGMELLKLLTAYANDLGYILIASPIHKEDQNAKEVQDDSDK